MPAPKEDVVQGAILDALARIYPQVWVCSIPNGAFLGAALAEGRQRSEQAKRRAARHMAKLKWQGLKVGAPDLVLVWPGAVGFIEVKREGEYPSPEQRDIHAILTAKGARVAVCRSIDDLIVTMTAWSVPTIARAA
jgi:hypothetical protein